MKQIYRYGHPEYETLTISQQDKHTVIITIRTDQLLARTDSSILISPPRAIELANAILQALASEEGE